MAKKKSLQERFQAGLQDTRNYAGYDYTQDQSPSGVGVVTYSPNQRSSSAREAQQKSKERRAQKAQKAQRLQLDNAQEFSNYGKSITNDIVSLGTEQAKSSENDRFYQEIKNISSELGIYGENSLSALSDPQKQQIQNYVQQEARNRSNPIYNASSQELQQAQDEIQNLIEEEKKKIDNYRSIGSSNGGISIFYNQSRNQSQLNDRIDESEKEIDRLESIQADIAKQYYYKENEEQFKKLNQNTQALKAYNLARKAEEDAERLRQVVPGQSDLTQDEIRYYSYVYGFTPGDLRSNSYALASDVDKYRIEKQDELKSLGYDYSRMAEYNDTMEAEKSASEQQQKLYESVSNSGFLGKAGYSLASVLASPAQGIEFAYNALSNIGRNDPQDLQSYRPYSSSYFPTTNTIQTIRGTVSEDMPAAISFLYNTGLSVAESAALVSTLGPAATPAMGLNAAASSMNSAIQNGASNDQALKIGIASGAAEIFFEKFSVDRLLSAKSISSAKDLAVEVLKQSGVEASEEMATEVANIIADASILGQKSDFQQQVQALMDDGLSEEDAKKQAYLNAIGQVGLAGLGGALSGGVTGTVFNIQNYRKQNSVPDQNVSNLSQQPTGIDSSQTTNVQNSTVQNETSPVQNYSNQNTQQTAQGQQTQQDSQQDQPSQTQQTAQTGSTQNVQQNQDNFQQQQSVVSRFEKEDITQYAPDTQERANAEAHNYILDMAGVELNDAGADRILSSQENKAAFEEITQTKIQGDLQQQREIVKQGIQNLPQQIEQYNQQENEQNSQNFQQEENVYSSQRRADKSPFESVENSAGFQTRYDELIQKYGKIETGENPARTVTVPRQVSDDTQVSKFARTAMEANATTDSVLPMIQQGLLKGMLSYKPDTNKAQMQRANEWAKSDTIYGLLKKWDKISSSNDMLSADDTVKGFLLYNNLVTAANVETDPRIKTELNSQAISILSKIQTSASMHGAASQAVRALKQMSPDMKLFALSQNIKALEEQTNARLSQIGQDPVEIKLNEGLSRAWLDAMYKGDEKLAESLLSSIYTDIARQTPKTFADRFRAFRYLAMLGNFKTQIRNFAGNVLMASVSNVKDEIAAGIELLIPKNQRTKYLGVLSATQDGRDLLKFANSDFENVRDIATGNAKGQDYLPSKNSLERAVAEEHAKFSAPFFKQWQQFSDYLMNNEIFGDVGFLKNGYRTAFANAMMARGHTLDDITSGRISDSELEEIRNYSVQQAMERTFRDLNYLSQLLQKVNFQPKTKIGQVGKAIVSGTLPFVRTPANVAVRAAEYSPAGLMKTITSDSLKLKNGEISATKFIDNLSKGITGSGIFLLGAFLNNIGILVGEADDEEKRQGIQNYSINIGGISYTLDWLSPVAIPLFAGAEMNDALDGSDITLLEAVFQGLRSAAGVFIEQSMLSGINDAIETIAYGTGEDADINAIYAILLSPIIGYFGQAVPTLVSQVAQAMEDEPTTSYVKDIEGGFQQNVARSILNTVNRIPGVEISQQPIVDTFGRREENGNVAWNIFESLFSPGYASKITTTDVDVEIDALKSALQNEISQLKEQGLNDETQDEIDRLQSLIDGISPSSRKSSISVNGENIRLSAEEYTKYQEEYGQKTFHLMQSAINSQFYDSLSSEEKANLMSELQSYADEYAKTQISDFEPDGWQKEMMDFDRSDEEIAQYAVLNELGRAFGNALDGDYLNEESNNTLDRLYDFYQSAGEDEENSMLEQFGSSFKKFVAARESGLSSAQYMQAKEIYSGISSGEAYEEMTASQKATEFANQIDNQMDITDAQKDVLKEEFSYYTMVQAEATTYNKLIDSGLSADISKEVYDTISELTPLSGYDEIIDPQKMYAISILDISNDEKYQAAKAIFDDSTSEKLTAAQYFDLSYNDYSLFRRVLSVEGDTDNNNYYSATEVAAVLRYMNMSDQAKAICWQLANTGWKSKNNPFDTAMGWRVYSYFHDDT